MSFPFFNELILDSFLDLNDFLIKNRASTFFMRVEENFEDADIKSGDIVVVDRSLNFSKNSIVVGVFNGEFVILRLSNIKKLNASFNVWGVVTFIIRKV